MAYADAGCRPIYLASIDDLSTGALHQNKSECGQVSIQAPGCEANLISMLIPQYLRDPDEEVAEMTQKKLRDSKVAISPSLAMLSLTRQVLVVRFISQDK